MMLPRKIVIDFKLDRNIDNNQFNNFKGLHDNSLLGFNFQFYFLSSLSGEWVVLALDQSQFKRNRNLMGMCSTNTRLLRPMCKYKEIRINSLPPDKVPHQLDDHFTFVCSNFKSLGLHSPSLAIMEIN